MRKTIALLLMIAFGLTGCASAPSLDVKLIEFESLERVDEPESQFERRRTRGQIDLMLILVQVGEPRTIRASVSIIQASAETRVWHETELSASADLFAQEDPDPETVRKAARAAFVRLNGPTARVTVKLDDGTSASVDIDAGDRDEDVWVVVLTSGTIHVERFEMH